MSNQPATRVVSLFVTFAGALAAVAAALSSSPSYAGKPQPQPSVTPVAVALESLNPSPTVDLSTDVFMRVSALMSDKAIRVPIASVTASGSLSSNPPSLAIDGDVNTYWNSGAYPPQWYQVDLGANTAVSLVRLLITQSPAGKTTHQIYGGSATDSLVLLGTISGPTNEAQWLNFVVPEFAGAIRYIQVVTTESPSWAAWKEIQVYSGALTDISQDATVTWQVSPSANAAVKINTLPALDGTLAGPVAVQATYKNTASNLINVTFVPLAQPKKLVSLALTPASRIMLNGASTTFKVTATYADKTTADVTSGAALTLNPPTAGTLTGAQFLAQNLGAFQLSANFGGLASNHVQGLVYQSGDPNVTIKTIGAKGGSITQGSISLSFPSKAFGQNTSVAVAQYAADTSAITDPFATVGGSYLVDDQGVKLSNPATLTLSYAAGSFPADTTPAIAVDHGNGWEPYAGTAGTNSYSIQLDHFSTMILVKSLAAAPASYFISGVPYYDQGDKGWCYVTSVAQVLSFYGKTSPDGGDMKNWTIAGMLGVAPPDGINPFEAKYAINQFGLSTSDIQFGNMIKQLWSATFYGNSTYLIHNYLKSAISKGTPVLFAATAPQHAVTLIGYDATYLYYHDTSGYLQTYGGDGTEYAKITWANFDRTLKFLGLVFADFMVISQPPAPVPKAADSDLAVTATGYRDPAPNSAPFFALPPMLQGTPTATSNHVLAVTENGASHPRGYYIDKFYANDTAFFPFGSNNWRGGPGPIQFLASSLGYASFPGQLEFYFKTWPTDAQLNGPGQIGIVSSSFSVNVAIHDPDGNTVWSHAPYNYAGFTRANWAAETMTLDLQGADQAYAQNFNKDGIYDVTVTTTSSTSALAGDTTRVYFPFMAVSSVKGKVMTNDAQCNAIPANGASVTIPGLKNKDGNPAQVTTDASGNYILNHVDVGGVSSGTVQASQSGHSASTSLPTPQIGQLTNVGDITITQPCSQPVSCNTLPATYGDGSGATYPVWPYPSAIYSCVCQSGGCQVGSGSGGLGPTISIASYIATYPGVYHCNMDWPSGPNIPVPGGCTPSDAIIGTLAWGAGSSSGVWPANYNPTATYCQIVTGPINFTCQ